MRSKGPDQPNHKKIQYIQLATFGAPAWGFGGPVRLFHEYAEWASHAFDVLLICGNIDSNFQQFSEGSGLENQYSTNRAKVFWGSFAKIGLAVLSPVILINLAKKVQGRPTKTVFHFWEMRGPVPLYLVFIKALFPKKTRIIFSVFGQLHYKKSLIRSIYDRLFLKTIFNNIDCCLVQNDHEESECRKIFDRYNVFHAAKVSRINLHCCANINKHLGPGCSIDKDAAKLALGINKDLTVMLFLGRLYWAKGIPRVIEVFKQYQISNPNSVLLIIGNDFGEQSVIEKIISQSGLSKSVTLVNNVYSNRWLYYLAADVFIAFPMIYEETMLAGIEAMSCGTPILVSKEADTPHVEALQAGKVISFSTTEAIVALKIIIENRLKYSKNARDAASTYFASDAVRSELLKIIERI